MQTMGDGFFHWKGANYSFKDRYLLQVNFSVVMVVLVLVQEINMRIFPSVSAGWIASDEAFMQPMSQILNYLKVRASYGFDW